MSTPWKINETHLIAGRVRTDLSVYLWHRVSNNSRVSQTAHLACQARIFSRGRTFSNTKIFLAIYRASKGHFGVSAPGAAPVDRGGHLSFGCPVRVRQLAGDMCLGNYSVCRLLCIHAFQCPVSHDVGPGSWGPGTPDRWREVDMAFRWRLSSDVAVCRGPRAAGPSDLHDSERVRKFRPLTACSLFGGSEHVSRGCLKHAVSGTRAAA